MVTKMKIDTFKVSSIEHTVEDKLRKAIEAQNGYVIKNQASRTTGRGKPDLSACIDGRYYGIEVKRNKGSLRTTIAQIKNLKQISYAGGLAFWAKTEDLVKPNFVETTIKDTFELPNQMSDQLKLINSLLSKKSTLAVQYVTLLNVIYVFRKD